VEIKTEADSNDITECAHDGMPSIGMFSSYDATVSRFICLCMTYRFCITCHIALLIIATYLPFTFYNSICLLMMVTKMVMVMMISGESKPECTGTPFRGPVETKESVPGPQNVNIRTGMVVPGPQ